MTDANEPPEVDFSELQRSNSLRETYHALWPYLVEKGRVLQRDLAKEVASMDQPYSEGSLNKQILKEIRSVLAEENIIQVEIPEEERRHRESMIYWVLPE